MKVLVTGANGLLGSELVRQLAGNSDFDVIGWVRELKTGQQTVGVQYIASDLINLDEVKHLVKVHAPDCIVHCAANVNLADCERNREYTTLLHVNATAALASAIPLHKFIYISTDSVFNGKAGNYTEDSVPDPLNYYAKSKLGGETAALQGSVNTIIARTNIYGVNPELKNSLAEWGLKKFAAGETVSGFTDVIFSPLSVSQLSHAIQTLLNSSYTGIINLACDEAVSKDSFLRTLAEEAGFSNGLIIPARMADMPSDIKRPFNTSLSANRFKELFNTTFSLRQGIRQVVSKFKATANEQH